MLYSIDTLLDEINHSASRMSRAQLRLWEMMCRVPEEWTLGDYGPCWVVAVIGENAIYYNHHEDGFEISGWTRQGTLQHYGSTQQSLEQAVQKFLNAIEFGYDLSPRSSPPILGSFEK